MRAEAELLRSMQIISTLVAIVGSLIAIIGGLVAIIGGLVAIVGGHINAWARPNSSSSRVADGNAHPVLASTPVALELNGRPTDRPTDRATE